MCSFKPSACIIVQRPEALAILKDGRDVLWDVLLEADPVDCVPVLATDPLYLLYTSGLRENPKAWCGIMGDIS